MNLEWRLIMKLNMFQVHVINELQNIGIDPQSIGQSKETRPNRLKFNCGQNLALKILRRRSQVTANRAGKLTNWGGLP